MRFLKDLLFPKYCLSCQKEGAWVCAECLEKIKKEIQPQFFCPRCYRDNQDGRACSGCRPFSFLDGAMSLSSYENEIIAKMVQLLKYQYIEEMAEVFGKLIENSKFPPKADPASRDIILPIPLHRRRYLERGFNQAELLARVWAKHLDLPVLSNALVRRRSTKKQVGLGGEERRRNLANAFVLKKSLSPSTQTVILVDDVFTTGSTLQECARVLKEGGVREVWGLTVAREK